MFAVRRDRIMQMHVARAATQIQCYAIDECKSVYTLFPIAATFGPRVGSHTIYAVYE